MTTDNDKGVGELRTVGDLKRALGLLPDDTPLGLSLFNHCYFSPVHVAIHRSLRLELWRLNLSSEGDAYWPLVAMVREGSDMPVAGDYQTERVLVGKWPGADKRSEAARWERCFQDCANIMRGMGTVNGKVDDKPYAWRSGEIEFTSFASSPAGPYDTLMWHERKLVVYFRPKKPVTETMGFMDRLDIRTGTPELLGQALGYLRQRAGISEGPK